uniref:Cytosine DNA methyltransferase n=1 Tax=Rhinella marina erythrocytic-like virus TaxID=2859906 RepID=A0A8F6UAE0_9VIRU|nr:cytosine DNA methyltransferase [Rhinella marina erythrocytic-like virus]
MRVLELFSGTKSVGKVTRMLGWTAVSLDLKNADININILEWDYKVYPKYYFDIIWASFPCETFSMTRQSNIGRVGKDGNLWTRERLVYEMETIGLPILRKTEEIVDYFEPKYYFLENPATGHAKNYIDRPMYILDYCQYAPSWGYRKRTAIWTNLTGFMPKLCVPNQCKAAYFSQETKKYRHILCTDSGNLHKNRKGTTTKERYRIPPQLIVELFKLTDLKPK